ncbi:hypothetical protein GCM10009547_26950 [Sporichthya brevicatena]|uniref:Uncharacterized protein n=1 Tax=Sporichthya brevicatena TaxID=171442 RepID=A0ABP3S101_9ACTN
MPPNPIEKDGESSMTTNALARQVIGGIDPRRTSGLAVRQEQCQSVHLLVAG